MDAEKGDDLKKCKGNIGDVLLCSTHKKATNVIANTIKAVITMADENPNRPDSINAKDNAAILMIPNN